MSLCACLFAFLHISHSIRLIGRFTSDSHYEFFISFTSTSGFFVCVSFSCMFCCCYYYLAAWVCVLFDALVFFIFFSYIHWASVRIRSVDRSLFFLHLFFCLLFQGNHSHMNKLLSWFNNCYDCACQVVLAFCSTHSGADQFIPFFHLFSIPNFSLYTHSNRIQSMAGSILFANFKRPEMHPSSSASNDWLECDWHWVLMNGIRDTSFQLFVLSIFSIFNDFALGFVFCCTLYITQHSIFILFIVYGCVCHSSV